MLGTYVISDLNPIQDGFFRGCSRKRGGGGGGGEQKANLHTYPTMMKLGSYTLPKNDPKNI